MQYNPDDKQIPKTFFIDFENNKVLLDDNPHGNNVIDLSLTFTQEKGWELKYTTIEPDSLKPYGRTEKTIDYIYGHRKMNT